MRLKCTSEKERDKEGGIYNRNVRGTVTEGYLMEGDASREPFDFAMAVPI